jgi:hypothetical protein
MVGNADVLPSMENVLSGIELCGVHGSGPLIVRAEVHPF